MNRAVQWILINLVMAPPSQSGCRKCHHLPKLLWPSLLETIPFDYSKCLIPGNPFHKDLFWESMLYFTERENDHFHHCLWIWKKFSTCRALGRHTKYQGSRSSPSAGLGLNPISSQLAEVKPQFFPTGWGPEQNETTVSGRMC